MRSGWDFIDYQLKSSRSGSLVREGSRACTGTNLTGPIGPMPKKTTDKKPANKKDASKKPNAGNGAEDSKVCSSAFVCIDLDSDRFDTGWRKTQGRNLDKRSTHPLRGRILSQVTASIIPDNIIKKHSKASEALTKIQVSAPTHAPHQLLSRFWRQEGQRFDKVAQEYSEDKAKGAHFPQLPIPFI